ncbi:hypothetical protein ROZALSC1DRAFT_26569 [Rozella allomycis CSF55]|uniref:Uncharacterized protein n=1 Tax=Rozella allomycis (strain CSF55) TaxID=988480 RepID=A0A075AWH9_ROZAC|nr:hypothetical protein O9G_002983 [Rozella allomycis CSF55]RKP22056.1 hypothetical protein ROZALSC1DRAFT_26569 [Rozella allomycis CSF55]|eukprot:EPZ34665.1 hypothetical protein O9G_002983 [Rozella allomycis CSF55]
MIDPGSNVLLYRYFVDGQARGINNHLRLLDSFAATDDVQSMWMKVKQHSIATNTVNINLGANPVADVIPMDDSFIQMWKTSNEGDRIVNDVLNWEAHVPSISPEAQRRHIDHAVPSSTGVSTPVKPFRMETPSMSTLSGVPMPFSNDSFDWEMDELQIGGLEEPLNIFDFQTLEKEEKKGKNLLFEGLGDIDMKWDEDQIPSMKAEVPEVTNKKKKPQKKKRIDEDEETQLTMRNLAENQDNYLANMKANSIQRKKIKFLEKEKYNVLFQSHVLKDFSVDLQNLWNSEMLSKGVKVHEIQDPLIMETPKRKKRKEEIEIQEDQNYDQVGFDETIEMGRFEEDYSNSNPVETPWFSDRHSSIATKSLLPPSVKTESVRNSVISSTSRAPSSILDKYIAENSFSNLELPNESENFLVFVKQKCDLYETSKTVAALAFYKVLGKPCLVN